MASRLARLRPYGRQPSAWRSQIFADPPEDLDLSRLSLGWVQSLVAAGPNRALAKADELHQEVARSRI